MRLSHVSVPACALVLVLASVVHADIASTSGSVVEIAPPASVLIGDLESSTEIRVIDEGVSVVPIGSIPDLFFDHVGPGFFDDTPPVIFTPMPDGAPLHSYLVHFDPVGTASTSLSGGITFDPGETIVGLQVHTPNLFSTDALFGAAGVTFPTPGDAAYDDRDFDDFSLVYDSGFVAPDLNSLTFDLKAELSIDQMRIFTILVPEPSSLMLVVAGVGWSLARRRAR